MIAKRWLVVGVLVVAVVGGLWVWSPWELPRPAEPAYDGRPLSYWLTNAAFDRPVSLDSNAIPFLIKALNGDSWFGAACYRRWVWPKLPTSVQQRLPRPAANSTSQVMAENLLSDLGPMAKPAIPALIRALKDDDGVVSFYAADLLAEIGGGNEAVVAALAEELKDKDAEVRRNAALFLARVGGGSKVAAAALTKALKDNDGNVRQAAAIGLFKIDPEAAAKAGIKSSSP